MQNNNSWQVIVAGIIEGHGEKEIIIAAVAKALRIDELKVQHLLDGKARVLKKNIPRAQAEKYRSLLIDLGVKASIQRMPQTAVVPPVVASSTEGLTLEPMVEQAADEQINEIASTDNQDIVCPKCGTQQKRVDECSHCGIIFSRYQQKVGESESEPDNNNSQFKSSSFKGFPQVYLAAVALIVFLCWKLFWNSAHYLPVGNDNHAIAQRHALAESFNKPRTDLQHLRSLIEGERYSDAEKIIQDLQNKAIADILWEEAYQNTLDGISSENKFSIESINNWVSQSGSAIAYLARGAFYITNGVDARGKRFAKDTSQEQFDAESRLHSLGVKDLRKALALNSQLFPAYTLLMISVDSSNESAQEYLAGAVKIAPGGYYFRYQYLRTLMPKWGGSYSEMNDFTDTLDSYAEKNPRLWLLKGFALAEKAHNEMHADNFKKAITLYSKALQFGVARDWLTKRAYALEMEGDGSLKELFILHHRDEILFANLKHRKFFYLESPYGKDLSPTYKSFMIDPLKIE